MGVMLSAIGNGRQVSVGVRLGSKLRYQDDHRQGDRPSRMPLGPK
jgi:hypothetical protein